MTGERLVLRGAPLEGESLLGCLLRIAEANHLGGGRRIAALAPNWKSRDTNEALEQLASLTGATVESLRQAAYLCDSATPALVTFGGATLRHAHVHLTTPRVCPRCIDGAGYAMRLWDLRGYAACHIHGERLVDRCFACNLPLRWQRPSIGECSCGNDLTSRFSDAAPHSARAIAEYLASLDTNDEVDSAGALPKTNLAQFMDALWFFGFETCEPGRAWRSYMMTKGTVSIAETVCEKAAKILLDWPAGLHRWLEAQVESACPGENPLSVLEPTLRRLKSSFGQSPTNFVVWEVRNYVARTWGGLQLPIRYFTTRPPGVVFHSVASARRLLKRSSTSLTKLIDGGAVPALVHAAGGRVRRYIRDHDLRALEIVSDHVLKPAEVAELIGLPVSHLRKLEPLGLVPMAREAGQARRFDMARVDRWMAGFYDGALPADGVDHPLALSELPFKRSVRLVDILRQVRSGGLAIYAVADDRRSFASLVIRWSDVFGVTAGIGGERLTYTAAARRLRLSIRMIPVLIRAGCLTTIREPNRPRHASAILVASVELFPVRYVLAKELALRWRTSTRAVNVGLGKSGLIPVIASDAATGISAVWIRQDIEWLGGLPDDCAAGLGRSGAV